MNHTVTIAVTFTVLGLITDLAYFLIHVATWFLLDGMWLESLVYVVIGGVTVAWLSTVGRRRLWAVLATEVCR